MENNKNRNKYSSKFKFGIVLETFKNSSNGNNGCITEIARQNNINNTMLSNWRKMFLENGYKIFESKDNNEILRLKSKISDLEKIIGKKEVELNLIKNFSDYYESKNSP